MATVDMRHVNFWLPPDFRPNMQSTASQKHHRGSAAAANSRSQAVPLYSKAGSRLTHSGISRSAVVTQEHDLLHLWVIESRRKVRMKQKILKETLSNLP
jgi:hypothetical protein